MFEIITIICCIGVLVLLKIFLNVNLNNIKNLKDRESEELNRLSKNF